MGVESIKLLPTSDGTDFYRDAYINVLEKIERFRPFVWDPEVNFTECGVYLVYVHQMMYP